MYLSRLILNPRSGKVRKDLSDCHEVHRTIMSAFPQADQKIAGARAQFGILHRLESSPSAGTITLYVQSREFPEWGQLPQGYLEEGHPENPACKDVSEHYHRLTEGMVLRFRLCANPTKKISEPGPDGRIPRQGKRVELYTEEAQLNWLQKKAKDHGFALVSVKVNNEIPDIRIVPGGKVQQLKGSRSVNDRHTHLTHPLTLASVVYDGHLRIVDAALFRSALENGIGSGKAYGFGLISLAQPGR